MVVTNDTSPVQTAPESTQQKAGKIAAITLIALGVLGLLASFGGSIAGCVLTPVGGIGALMGCLLGMIFSTTAIWSGVMLLNNVENPPKNSPTIDF